MKRKLFQVTIALFFGATAFTGCAKKIVNTDVAGLSKEKPAAKASSGEAKLPQANVAGATMPGTPSTELANMIIEDVYFDFDRYSIRADSKKALEDDAALLKNNGAMKITIEGHCDERGPDEYNLVLGQKRADSVKRYLKDLGVDSSRIATISFGSEKPFCSEHNEACWQKNRTAHLVKN